MPTAACEVPINTVQTSRNLEYSVSFLQSTRIYEWHDESIGRGVLCDHEGLFVILLESQCMVWGCLLNDNAAMSLSNSR